MVVDVWEELARVSAIEAEMDEYDQEAQRCLLVWEEYVKDLAQEDQAFEEAYDLGAFDPVPPRGWWDKLMAWLDAPATGGDIRFL